jgi:hypothetical protein
MLKILKVIIGLSGSRMMLSALFIMLAHVSWGQVVDTKVITIFSVVASLNADPGTWQVNPVTIIVNTDPAESWK